MASEVAGVAWVSKGPRPKKKEKKAKEHFEQAGAKSVCELLAGELST